MKKTLVIHAISDTALKRDVMVTRAVARTVWSRPDSETRQVNDLRKFDLEVSDERTKAIAIRHHNDQSDATEELVRFLFDQSQS